MKSFSPQFTLKCFVLWNALCAVWMAFFVFLNLRSLVGVGYKGPYVGIGIDSRSLFTIAGLPIKLLGVIAGFYFGRVGETAVEIVAATLYISVAIGIWRHSNGARRLGIALNILGLALLILCLGAAFTSPLLPELHPQAIAYFSVFILIYSLLTIWLFQGRVKDFFAPRAVSAIGN